MPLIVLQFENNPERISACPLADAEPDTMVRGSRTASVQCAEDDLMDSNSLGAN